MSVRATVVVRASDTRATEPYEMFDVESVDLTGARLIGPLLLEVGEEIELRIARGEVGADVTARVTAVERGERVAVSVVEFVDEDAAERMRPVVNA